MPWQRRFAEARLGFFGGIDLGLPLPGVQNGPAACAGSESPLPLRPRRRKEVEPHTGLAEAGEGTWICS